MKRSNLELSYQSRHHVFPFMSRYSLVHDLVWVLLKRLERWVRYLNGGNRRWLHAGLENVSDPRES